MSDIEVRYLQNIMGQIIGEIHSNGFKEIYNEPISTNSELLGKIEQLEKQNAMMQEALDKIIDKAFDIPRENRLFDSVKHKESWHSLIAREVLAKLTRGE